jgi:hypothetical protein
VATGVIPRHATLVDASARATLGVHSVADSPVLSRVLAPQFWKALSRDVPGETFAFGGYDAILFQLVYERLLGNSSVFAPYVAGLLEQDMEIHPTWWSDEKLDHFYPRGPVFDETRQVKDVIEQNVLAQEMVALPKLGEVERRVHVELYGEVREVRRERGEGGGGGGGGGGWGADRGGRSGANASGAKQAERG